MYTTEINQIISLLKSIANSSISNKIAFGSVIIALGALISGIYSNHQTKEQYINSLSPLLSMELTDNSGQIFLSITNTGHSEATDINITFLKIENNGTQGFTIDDVFKQPLTIYPNESIHGVVAFSGKTVVNDISPQLQVEISYHKGNTKKAEHYSRTVSFSKSIDDEKTIHNDLKNIENRLNEISHSSIRMANYFEGKFLLKKDEIESSLHSSLYNDLKRVFNNEGKKEENP